MRGDLPEPYRTFVEVLLDECGSVFDASATNIQAVSEQMQWSPEQTKTVISILGGKGVLRAEKRLKHGPRRWTVVERSTAAA